MFQVAPGHAVTLKEKLMLIESHIHWMLRQGRRRMSLLFHYHTEVCFEPSALNGQVLDLRTGGFGPYCSGSQSHFGPLFSETPCLCGASYLSKCKN
jgi:hypothetical protein